MPEPLPTTITFPASLHNRGCFREPLRDTVFSPGETEAGSAGTQPDQGIARPTVCRWHHLVPASSLAGTFLTHRTPEFMPWKIQPDSLAVAPPPSLRFAWARRPWALACFGGTVVL